MNINIGKSRFLLIFLILLTLPIQITFAEDFSITSKNVILYNMNDQKILYEQKSEDKVSIASLTKIMTTIVAIEQSSDLEKEVVITKDALQGIEDYSKIGLKVGDKVTIKDLLYATMLPSGADAANALAITISGSTTSFVKLMNEKVDTLKLTNTHFDNVIGIDSKTNYSTAKDLATLLIYALKNSTFKEIFTTKSYVISSLNLTLKTTLNSYAKAYGLDTSDITGSKSGFTDEAGLCLASTATIDDVNYLLITLGADTKNRSNAVKDTLEIYNYYSSTYSYQTVLKKNQALKTLPIKWGHQKEYTIKASQNISLYLDNSLRKNRLKYEYNGIDEITYKNKKGSKLGTISITYEGEVLTTYDVYLNETLSFYHPVLYTIIILSFLTLITSLKEIIKTKKKAQV